MGWNPFNRHDNLHVCGHNLYRTTSSDKVKKGKVSINSTSMSADPDFCTISTDRSRHVMPDALTSL